MDLDPSFLIELTITGGPSGITQEGAHKTAHKGIIVRIEEYIQQRQKRKNENRQRN
jgi:hypothetical protein